MEMFFANGLEVAKLSLLSRPKKAPRAVRSLSRQNGKRPWWDVLLEQCVNSAIVGGIAGLSTLIAGDISWKVVLFASGLTALVELRKYRRL